MTISKNFTKTEQKIINFLSNYPNREFYSQEIVNKLHISKGGASEILRDLSKKKIVSLNQKGNMKFYQINTNNLAVKRYRINLIINKINPLVEKIKKISKEIVLFGSASRGEQTIDSDIDLFVLTSNRYQVGHIFYENKNKLPIKPIIKTPSEWSELEIKEPEFYNEVKRGIKLY